MKNEKLDKKISLRATLMVENKEKNELSFRKFASPLGKLGNKESHWIASLPPECMILLGDL